MNVKNNWQHQEQRNDHQMMPTLPADVDTKENIEASSNLGDTSTAERERERDRARYKGTLLWFNEKKIGFIQCDEEPEGNSAGDLFVYESELKFDLELIYKGMRLQFDIELYTDYYHQEKRKAVNVMIDIDDNESMISCTSYQSLQSLQSLSSCPHH